MNKYVAVLSTDRERLHTLFDLLGNVPTQILHRESDVDSVTWRDAAVAIADVSVEALGHTISKWGKEKDKLLLIVASDIALYCEAARGIHWIVWRPGTNLNTSAVRQWFEEAFTLHD